MGTVGWPRVGRWVLLGLPSTILCHAEFSRRWCTLQDGVLSYYESDRNAAPNGEIKVDEIVCLVNNPPHTHGYGWTPTMLPQDTLIPTLPPQGIMIPPCAAPGHPNSPHAIPERSGTPLHHSRAP